MRRGGKTKMTPRSLFKNSCPKTTLSFMNISQNSPTLVPSRTVTVTEPDDEQIRSSQEIDPHGYDIRTRRTQNETQSQEDVLF